MVFNHCIYGTITNAGTSLVQGDLKLTYWNYSLQETFSTTVSITNGLYQFNLGNQNLKGINSSITDKDIVILEYFNPNKQYDSRLLLDTSNNIQEFNIDISNWVGSSGSANFSISEQIVKAGINTVIESEDVYSYFTVSDSNSVIKESNKNFSFIPKTNDTYTIKEYSVDSNNNTSTKEYSFNAIVSSSSITRSNKCKNINDTIRILFQNPSNEPVNLEVYNNNILDTTGTLSDEGKGVFSYNYTFTSSGYFLFKVNYTDNGIKESFILTYKVLANYLKVYYLDSNFTTGLTLSGNMYFLTDTVNSTSVNFNEIGNGLYVSDDLNVQYGDYMFEVLEEEYIVSFEECSSTSNSNTACSSKDEEIYWIFPGIGE